MTYTRDVVLAVVVVVIAAVVVDVGDAVFCGVGWEEARAVVQRSRSRGWRAGQKHGQSEPDEGREA